LVQRGRGARDATKLRVDSPFDYPRMRACGCRRVCPSPNDASHAQAIANCRTPAARLHGRTFVLTTTLRVLERFAQRCAMPRSARAANSSAGAGHAAASRLLQALLFRPRSRVGGLAEFLGGHRRAREALQCVIIDKLPFPRPTTRLCRRITRAAGARP